MKVYISNYPTYRFYHNWLYKLFDYLPEQKRKVHIDPWDTWSMDLTLAEIIVPMLKQLKASTHSYPSTMSEEQWDEILDKMIWSFEQKLIDWEQQYVLQEGEIDWDAGEVDSEGNKTLVWSKEHIIDRDARNAHQARMDEGFALFGKHYESLWD
jgi:hypothetical protein